MNSELSVLRAQAAKVGDQIRIKGVFHSLTVMARNGHFIVAERYLRGRRVACVVIDVYGKWRTSEKLSTPLTCKELIHKLTGGRSNARDVDYISQLKASGSVPLELRPVARL